MRDVIAWAALLFSGISLIVSIRTKRSQDQLISRQIEAHDRATTTAVRANLSASIKKEDGWAGGGTQWKLVIRNRGPADAHDVDLEFNEPQQLVPSSELKRKLPLSVLPPGEEIRLVASAAMGQPSKYEITLRWRDTEPRAEDRQLVV